MVVEIQGLNELIKAFNNMVPVEMRPPILRKIASSPATRAASRSRQLQPIGDTGQTAKTIGILKVKNPNQPFVEVGYRGRSLGHIYLSKERITRHNRGTIKGFPWLFQRAGNELKDSIIGELTVDITKVFVRGFKKYGLG